MRKDKKIIAYCKVCLIFHEYQDDKAHIRRITTEVDIWEPLLYPITLPSHYFGEDPAKSFDYVLKRLNHLITGGHSDYYPIQIISHGEANAGHLVLISLKLFLKEKLGTKELNGAYKNLLYKLIDDLEIEKRGRPHPPLSPLFGEEKSKEKKIDRQYKTHYCQRDCKLCEHRVCSAECTRCN